MAVDLKRKGFADEVIGVEAEPVNAAAAEKIGLVDRMAGLDQCILQKNVVVADTSNICILPRHLRAIRSPKANYRKLINCGLNLIKSELKGSVASHH